MQHLRKIWILSVQNSIMPKILDSSLMLDTNSVVRMPRFMSELYVNLVLDHSQMHRRRLDVLYHKQSMLELERSSRRIRNDHIQFTRNTYTKHIAIARTLAYTELQSFAHINRQV